MKKDSIIFLLLAFTLFLPSCKKFEEDTELLHLRTVKKRIEGYKVLTKHLSQSENLLPYWHSRFGNFYIHLTLDNYIDNKKGTGFKVRVYEQHSNKSLCSGQWGFKGSEWIFIHFNCLDSDTTSTFPYSVHQLSGSIVRLSNSEIILRKTSQINSDLSYEVVLRSTNP